VSPAIGTKTQSCDTEKAKKRLADARAYYGTAELVSADDTITRCAAWRPGSRFSQALQPPMPLAASA